MEMEKLYKQFLETHITSEEGASKEEAGRPEKEVGGKDKQGNGNGRVLCT